MLVALTFGNVLRADVQFVSFFPNILIFLEFIGIAQQGTTYVEPPLAVFMFRKRGGSIAPNFLKRHPSLRPLRFQKKGGSIAQNFPKGVVSEKFVLSNRCVLSKCRQRRAVR